MYIDDIRINGMSAIKYEDRFFYKTSSELEEIILYNHDDNFPILWIVYDNYKITNKEFIFYIFSLLN